jgi:uncharacterized phage protein (TIGR01671 family)
MREIKFRVWNQEGNFMDSAWLIDWEHGKVCHSKHNQSELDDCILLQYTGLKDKNGKEIYEGDIIRRYFEIGRVIYDEVTLGAEDYEIDDAGYFIGVVHYRPSEGYVLNKCTKYNDDWEIQLQKSGVKIYAKRAEVIGNVFENPDLLEETR